MKVIIFDYDGTICDTFDAYAHEYVRVAKKYKIKVKGKKDFKELYKINLAAALMKKGLSKKEVCAFIHDMRKPYMQNPALLKPFQKMRDSVKKLAAHAAIFIVTSNSTSMIKNSIKYHNMQGIKKVIGQNTWIKKVIIKCEVSKM